MLSFLAYSLTVIMLTFSISGDIGMGPNVNVKAGNASLSASCVTGGNSQCTMQVPNGTYSLTAKPGAWYPTPPGYHWTCDVKAVTVSNANMIAYNYCRLRLGF